MNKKLTFIVPCRNAAPNLPDLIASLKEQSDPDWHAVFIDDQSEDTTASIALEMKKDDPRISLERNSSRLYALRNIVETASDIEGIVAVIDGDDQLCNPDAVKLVRAAHEKPGMVVWTAHRWDINGLNISRDMPEKVNPYQFPWCTSHLRTFDAALLKEIPDSNFQDHHGRWFERGYDQALMLPLLYKATGRRYLPDVCYLYKINSCSVDDRDWAERKQLQTVNLVRARGFLGE